MGLKQIFSLFLKKIIQNGRLKKPEFFKIANSQKIFVKISWIGPWISGIVFMLTKWVGPKKSINVQT
jgi:hypothetical protein